MIYDREYSRERLKMSKIGVSGNIKPPPLWNFLTQKMAKGVSG